MRLRPPPGMSVAAAPAALRTVYRILKPGGVVLSTFPGITQTGDPNWRDTWYWSFTTRSAHRLFSDVFGEENVTLRSYGNVLAATAFLYGLADRDLSREELDHHDPAFDVTIAVRAGKPINLGDGLPKRGLFEEAAVSS